MVASTEQQDRRQCTHKSRGLGKIEKLLSYKVVKPTQEVGNGEIPIKKFTLNLWHTLQSQHTGG
ncbi:hypothetical protein, partial [Pseudomonas aeruginosa]|jgi:hypothetical protein|uniref:hypothetical protein n=1 Tax=Pseudomonas aeruginosa TaxID=287 RepID=UPI001C3E8E3E